MCRFMEGREREKKEGRRGGREGRRGVMEGREIEKSII